MLLKYTIASYRFVSRRRRGLSCVRVCAQCVCFQRAAALQKLVDSQHEEVGFEWICSFALCFTISHVTYTCDLAALTCDLHM